MAYQLPISIAYVWVDHMNYSFLLEDFFWTWLTFEKRKTNRFLMADLAENLMEK
jgi:hypothetical protein